MITDRNLADLRQEFADYRDHQLHAAARGWSCCSAHPLADQVPALLAEVERLRAVIAAAHEVVPSRLGAGRQIGAHIARGDSADIVFYSGASLALAKVGRALRGESR